MIFNFISEKGPVPEDSLAALPEGQRAVLHEFTMASAISEHLMNLGFVPGVEVVAARCCPGGDPRIYRVDDCTEVALRRDVSRHIVVRPVESVPALELVAVSVEGAIG
jgi:Fe2+ transport system protein FeoA